MLTMTRALVLSSLLLLLVLPGSAEARTSVSGRRDMRGLVDQFSTMTGGPSRLALDAAMTAYTRAVDQGAVANPRYLTVIDYSLPSVKPRMWVLDLDSIAILYHELVAHGRGSGETMATAFSNRDGSHMTSLGLFVTDDSYVGSNGYSLRLSGLEPGVNDRAYERAIVVHGAPYVSDATARSGRLGRSWGCPAVRLEVARTIIDTIKGGSVLFAYGPTA